MKAEYDFRGATRGAIDPQPPGKTRITIRLDDEVLTWFKDVVNRAGGGNYQTLINKALREHISRQRESLEETVRRVLREEIPRLRAVPKKRLKGTGERRRRIAASEQH